MNYRNSYFPAMKNCKTQTKEVMNVSSLAAELKALSVFSTLDAKKKGHMRPCTACDSPLTTSWAETVTLSMGVCAVQV